MLEFIVLARNNIARSMGVLLLVVSGVALFILVMRRVGPSRTRRRLIFAILIGVFLLMITAGVPRFSAYPFWLWTFGPADGPVMPLRTMVKFITGMSAMEHVQNIARNPNDVGVSVAPGTTSVVKISLETKEVIAEIAPGIVTNYWTFDGTVPGPFLRVREGDTVELTLRNHPSSIHHHSIDLHAVTGPGGGAAATTVVPGEAATFTFKALNPGLYVYHCAYPNVATHMAHGMYGLILVEPREGLPTVDKEFYVMQGEFYFTGQLGKRGLQIFDAKRMLDGQPSYVVFNGKTGSLVENMAVEAGDRVRLYVGNGGVNLISSFHVIGEIFDRVFPEAAMGSEPHRNIQTTLVPAGGATIVEFTADVPGKYVLVDHALARLDRGAWGVLRVEGKENPEVFRAENKDHGHSSGH